MSRSCSFILAGLLCSGCSLFSVGSSAPADPDAGEASGAPPGEAVADQDNEAPPDFSTLSAAASHPALSRYVAYALWDLSYDREAMSPLLAIDLGGTAHDKVDPAAVYLYAAHRATVDGARLAEQCGAPRFADKLAAIEPFAEAGDLAEPSAELQGWTAAAENEAGSEGAIKGDLQTHSAVRCVGDVGEHLAGIYAAASKLEATAEDSNATHAVGKAVVAGWVKVLDVGQQIGSPWDITEQASRELLGLLAMVRSGKAPDKLPKLAVKPVHPALILYVEKAASELDAVQWAELVGVDLADTARGSNVAIHTYAADVALTNLLPELLEACGAGPEAEQARKSMPKIKKPADVDAVYAALDALEEDPRPEAKHCIGKAWRPVGETVGNLVEAGRYEKSGINQTLPYADKAFVEWHSMIKALRTDPTERFELTMSMLGDILKTMKKWKRRPAKDMQRYDD